MRTYPKANKQDSRFCLLNVYVDWYDWELREFSIGVEVLLWQFSWHFRF
uniref:Uncharacterized protein n=1 Tax=viral metagenome TaxID=1070528 RepID=A0A6M3KJN9_9ZZZZ